MSANTKIEWTDATWTPIRARRFVPMPDGDPGDFGEERIGWHCEKVSAGCKNCYAEPINRRLGTGLDYKPGHLARGDVSIFLDEKMLLAPLRWKKPRRIFVCSMTDLFADFVTDEMIDRVFAVMALCPQHSFQVLTKRPERMRAWLTAARAHPVALEALDVTLHAMAANPKSQVGKRCIIQGDIAHLRVWPLPNVWLGVSVEDQESADTRIPHLLATPAKVRFLSAEPLLGLVDLSSHLWGRPKTCWDCTKDVDCGCGYETRSSLGEPALHWVICGGESGPGARPMHPDWARGLRDQCAAAGVAFHFKQWGEWAPSESGEAIGFDPDIAEHDCAFDVLRAETMRRVGKKSAGRLLDGVEHDGVPA